MYFYRWILVIASLYFLDGKILSQNRGKLKNTAGKENVLTVKDMTKKLNQTRVVYNSNSYLVLGRGLVLSKR
jgi:hypothetical protein